MIISHFDSLFFFFCIIIIQFFFLFSAGCLKKIWPKLGSVHHPHTTVPPTILFFSGYLFLGWEGELISGLMMDRRLDKVLLLFPPVSFGYWSTNVEKKEEEEEENVCVVRHKHTDQYNRLHAPPLICVWVPSKRSGNVSLSLCVLCKREREKKESQIGSSFMCRESSQRREAGSLFTHTHTQDTFMCVCICALLCCIQ